ncbi:nad(p)h nitroreductase ydgi-related [Anaeramoeba ignava]|uniref:Nad(P)h nitroreductase ydgi-related n=1 Tax=Anaeramoeba ignava TaxID=1746090 RepID=A0A9Q0LRD6_ANAIG|nr:nad(p)h nitroreductase ydgi-related [Anaeramoeba ignava]|eukprot:Anaeramoba_ignava/a613266_143.p1 GENE.a613266_143~~a613266_143.p1  ORF type:complete len:228 (-),score=63.39 a613266_143:30-713(-)
MLSIISKINSSNKLSEIVQHKLKETIKPLFRKGEYSTKEETNEVLETIKTRRSTRAFERKQIKKNEIEKILEVAKNTPSAMNKQPWKVYVVQKEELIRKIGGEISEVLTPQMTFLQRAKKQLQVPDPILYDAPTVLFITTKKERSMPLFIDIDVGIYLANLNLAAESLGINSVIVGLTKMHEEPVLKFLNIPDDETFKIALALGYRDSNRHPPEKKEIVTGNIKWID